MPRSTSPSPSSDDTLRTSPWAVYDPNRPNRPVRATAREVEYDLTDPEDGLELSNPVPELPPAPADPHVTLYGASRTYRALFDNYTSSSNGVEPVPAGRRPAVDPIPAPAPAPPPAASTARPKRRRIRGVGIEIEGGWDSPPPSQVKRDGSVFRDESRYRYQGEVVSEPHDTLDTALPWLRSNYPPHVDHTCGLHVHVSVSELNYSRLMEPEFEQFFNEEIEKFLQAGLASGAPGYDLLQSRFRGENLYCQKKFRPEQQLWLNDAYGDRNTHPRYSQLNFCYRRHGTVECRLFPAFPDVNDAVKAVEMFYETVRSYLRKFGPASTEKTYPIEATIEVSS